MMREAAEEHGVYVMGGVIEDASPIVPGSWPRTTKETLYNTIPAFGPDGALVARYRKVHLSRVKAGPDATAEATVFQPGDHAASFEVNGLKVGMCCCFDLRFKHLSQFYEDDACDVLAYPSAFLHSTGQHHWELLLRSRAVDHQVYSLGSNHSMNPAAAETPGETVMYVGHRHATPPTQGRGPPLQLPRSPNATAAPIAHCALPAARRPPPATHCPSQVRAESYRRSVGHRAGRVPAGGRGLRDRRFEQGVHRRRQGENTPAYRCQGGHVRPLRSLQPHEVTSAP